MSDVLLRPRPASRRRMGVTGLAVVAGVVLLGTLLGVGHVTALPPRVERLTIVNPHPYHVNVSVSDGRPDAQLLLGTVKRNRSAAYDEVIDQGSTWRFRFSYAGIEAGELVVSRSSLEADGWKLSVPPETAQRLKTEGLGPSAR